MGIVVTFVSPILQVNAGRIALDRAAADMLTPLGDMVLFAGFFGAAYYYRTRPDIHRRLVVAATVALMFAAVVRLRLGSPWLLLGVWLAPLLVAMVVDLISRGRISLVYCVSLAIMFVAFFRIFYRRSEAWLVIGRALLSPFLNTAG